MRLLALAALALLAASPLRAEDGARADLGAAAADGRAARGGSPENAKLDSSRAFDANGDGGTTDATGSNDASRRLGLTKPTPRATVDPDKDAPPAPKDKKDRAKGDLSTGLMLGGAAALGGLQGFMATGIVGAFAGAGLGLAAAWLFHKKDYGGAFGVTAGAIVGTALGGPIGGLIGAVAGGLLGHFLGKLFL